MERRSAALILHDAIERTRWNDDTVIDVLIEYIQNQDSNEAFADYISERVEDEEAM